MKSEWKECQLGDLITFQRGHDLPKTKMQGGNYPVVGSNGIIGYHNEYTTESPSITIGRSGNVGKPFLYNGKSWSHNTSLYIKEYKNVDPIFIYYFLQTLDLGNYAGGSAVPTLNRNHIHTLNVCVPMASEEQKQIASILSSLDDKIMLNTAINENLESQAQAIFKFWFVDFEPFGGVMPEEWTEKSVYDLAEYINGAAFKKNEYSTEGIPIIKIAELKNGITDSTQYCCIEKDEKYYFDNKAILFSWSGNPETSIDTFLWYRGKAILNQHTFRVVSKYNAPAFTYFLLKYLKPKFTHIASNKQTTGLGHVTVSDLKRLQFSCSTDAIEEFEKMSKPLFDMIYNTYVESNRLSKLRDVLLPKLMKGEIDVSEVKI